MRNILLDVSYKTDTNRYMGRNGRGKETKMETSFRKTHEKQVANYKWLFKGLKRRTETLIMAAQEQAIVTRHVKAETEVRKDVSPKCGPLQSLKDISHIIGRYTKPCCKVQHDKFGINVYWLLCKKYELNVGKSY